VRGRVHVQAERRWFRGGCIVLVPHIGFVGFVLLSASVCCYCDLFASHVLVSLPFEQSAPLCVIMHVVKIIVGRSTVFSVVHRRAFAYRPTA
jgi:hypothetical protein